MSREVRETALGSVCPAAAGHWPDKAPPKVRVPLEMPVIGVLLGPSPELL